MNKYVEFIQRGKRGYSETDTWNIDSWFLDCIVPMLKELRKNHHGYPSYVKDNETWEGILDEMINCFENMRVNIIDEKSEKEWEEYQKDENNEELKRKWLDKRTEVYNETMKYKDRAFELFSEYFYSLWD